jgi:hypothetical protein
MSLDNMKTLNPLDLYESVFKKHLYIQSGTAPTAATFRLFQLEISSFDLARNVTN